MVEEKKGKEKVEKDDITEFDNVDWGDISKEIAKNKEMVRSDHQKNIAITTEFQPKEQSNEVKLGFLHDVSLNLSVEVGTRKLNISDIMQYKVGSIIELDNVVGQQLKIFVNDVLIGLGEIIEREQKYGIKINELLDENKRLEALSTKALPNI